MIDLSGLWSLALTNESDHRGMVTIPGCLQAQGYGEAIALDTPFVSALHDRHWYLRDEYAPSGDGEVNIPFLSAPPRHFLGEAWYSRMVDITEGERYVLSIELAHWKSRVWIDGEEKGSDFSLCSAHEIALGYIPAGAHRLTVCIDNSFCLPYRPDAHAVSDALGATWNGMAGAVLLLTEAELAERDGQRRRYAREHPRVIEARDGMFFVDGKQEYFRGTHFGGEYPITGIPDTGPAYWDRIMRIIGQWGLNFIRCHSFCPPEAAFAAADRAGVFIQVEAGMWNVFNEGIPMLSVLREESRRILRHFGHHPSFVLFSPSNEPSGLWYQVLAAWVRETREYDDGLGYGGRRLYTAQSGWFYDKSPSKITREETDYLYFHRSAYGPILGGNIRNHEGWKGKDYRPSLEGATLPVIAHEMGQWCAYPDFSVIDKFTGYLQPSNYRAFKASAERAQLLKYNSQFAHNSGKQQVRLYKEELEANFRTPHIYGFELLDLHDYLGQGTATVGVLDAFWDEKGYVSPEEWRRFCAPTVLLARLAGYVYTNRERITVPIEICHFGDEPLHGAHLHWSLECDGVVLDSATLPCPPIPLGKNIRVAEVKLDLSLVKQTSECTFTVRVGAVVNEWPLHVFVQQTSSFDDVVYTKDWREAKTALGGGKAVLYTPRLDELDYDCPPASFLSVYWNGQMGPTWRRQLGMVISEEHPIFKDFPTAAHGGWQWEEILERGRGFHMEGIEAANIVRLIDDHNRNLDRSLIFACRMLSGTLMVASCDLEGSFAERPAAYTLKQAIVKYLGSGLFKSNTKLDPCLIERRLHPNQVMRCLHARVKGPCLNSEALVDGNPNTTAIIEGDAYPLALDITVRETEAVGVIILQGQRDRMHSGDVRQIRLEAICDGKTVLLGEYTLRATVREQRLAFTRTRLSTLRLTVLDGFKEEMETVWEERYDGWHQVRQRTKARSEIAVLNLIVTEPIEGRDECYWLERVKAASRDLEE